LGDSEYELKDVSDDELLEAGSPSPSRDQPESCKDKNTDASESESSVCFETFRPYDNYVPVIERALTRNL
ncbi:hypothetical protein Tco_0279812, partial [Tanacetum coccineum]